MNKFEHILFYEILPLITKPGRYTGNEINVIRKDWSKVDVTCALIFPDLYELGMSHVGLEILYHILNRESYIAAERVFAPWIDLEEILRDKGISLFSLESKRPIRDFDILGITLQYELHYTNILNILNLGAIPIHAKDRGEDDPIVLAGGPCAFNPEPMADFIDAFVIGDGEEVVVEIAALMRQMKSAHANRNKILQSLSSINSVYVPRFYKVIDDKFSVIVPEQEGVPEKILSRTIASLDSGNYPTRPLIPLIETTHDRYSIEIMRGCSRGCRFCNAGIIYRPVRERSVDDIVTQAITGIKNTGYDEVSLLSLSTSDHSQLPLLLSKLTSSLSENYVNISFPSLRAETFSRDLAKYAKAVRKSGLTLAPEAGTEYLRKVINKTNTNEDLTNALTIAFEEGWKIVKLYFMIGQPGERMEDIEGIVQLINNVARIAKKNGGKSIKVSISPFVPKPHTPFQWSGQNSEVELQEKISYLRKNIRSDMIQISWRDFEVSLLECVLGRGDRRVGKLIQKAYELGAKFDAWGDQFNFDIWKKAIEQSGISISNYTAEIPLDEKMPWDFIDKGITKSFLKREYKKAFQGEETFDCRLTSCHACGLMEHSECQSIIQHTKSKKADPPSHDSEADTTNHFGRSKRLIKLKTETSVLNVRIKYIKDDSIRFTSHLDLIRIFERSFHRAELSLVYSQGFNPHPKIAFGPPLAMGYTSDAEYMDVPLYRERIHDLQFVLNKKLPPGIQLVDAKILLGKGESLASIINRADYELTLHQSFDQSYLNNKCAELLSRNEIIVERAKKDSVQQVDIRPFIRSLSTNNAPNTLSLSTVLENGRSVRVNEILSELIAYNENEVALTRVKRSGLFIQIDDEARTPLDY